MPIHPDDALWTLIWNVRVLPMMQCQSLLKVEAQIGPDGIQRIDLIFEDLSVLFLPD